MCDGFSEAFMVAAAGASEGVGALAGGYTTMAGIGEGLGVAAATATSTTGLAVGTAAMSGVSSAIQANAQQQTAEYQSQVDANNAKMAGWNASAAIQQGQFQAEQQGLQSAQLLGQQRVSVAANGLSPDSGSAIDQMASTRFLNSMDVSTIQNNAARAAWGYDVQGSNFLAQSGLDKWEAQNNNPALIGGIASAGSLLSTATLYKTAGNTNLFKSFTGGGA